MFEAGTRTARAVYKDTATISRGDVLARNGQRVVRAEHFNDGDFVLIHIYTSKGGRNLRHPIKTYAGDTMPVRA
jgi:hypothetical protein